MSRRVPIYLRQVGYAVIVAATSAGFSTVIAQRPHKAAEARPHSTNGISSRRLDVIGTQVFDLEKRAFDRVAEGPFFQDPEDAQSKRAGFFSSSDKILSLAVATDSSNAAAWYHWAVVTVARSELGFGNFDAALIHASIDRFNKARTHAATREFAGLRPKIDRALEEERRVLAAIK